MKRLAAAPAFASAILLSGLAAAVPAAAQEDAGDKVNMVIVYGEDACPQPADGEITVCARKAEDERFRIPENLRTSDSAANTAWTRRVESYEMVGDFGALSCDPAGAGGFTGCTQQMINAAYADKREGSDVRFSQLIEAARAERLSTIDADAAAEQERVEQIEREYMERLERERKGQLPGEVAAPAQSDAAVAEPVNEEAQPEPEGDGEG
ncbi:hypothetical protein [Altererythrobacter sp.]|uniref:hypothetical protein n=1 Tax=Altererythrobacter sp. TaxID=1872480 RepID=UPI003D0637F6